ncbi:MAG: hypothetical protein V3U07_04525, partial [Nitrospirales bacterium]
QLKYTNIPFVSFGPIVSGNIHMGPVEYITIFRAPIPSDHCHESSQARGQFKKARCLTRTACARQRLQQKPENAACGLFQQAHMRTLMIQGRDSMEGD